MYINRIIQFNLFFIICYALHVYSVCNPIFLLHSVNINFDIFVYSSEPLLTNFVLLKGTICFLEYQML